MTVGVVTRSSDLDRYLSRLARQAEREREIPSDLADEAQRATARRFSQLSGALTRTEHARVRAYFWGVVRRRSIQSRGADLKDVRALYLLLSVADDLRAAGRTDGQIIREIEAEYARDVPPRTLQRLRGLLQSRN